MKEQWEELRDMAARQYEEDAKDDGSPRIVVEPEIESRDVSTAPAVLADLDLSMFSLTDEQEREIRIAANELASWVAKNGAASPVDEAALFRRVERACDRAGKSDDAYDLIFYVMEKVTGKQWFPWSTTGWRSRIRPPACAVRANIVDRIIIAASSLKNAGLEPTTVYLGEKEVGELLAYAQKLKATMGSPVQIEEKVCGYSLVRVKKESYFAVH